MKVRLFALLAVLSFFVPGGVVSAQSLTGLSASDRASIESVCSYPKLMEGPASYHVCVNKQIAQLGADKAPSWAGLSASDRASIESVCSYPKLMEGPVSYHACLNKQLTELRGLKVDSSTQAIGKAETECKYLKPFGEPPYRACVKHEMAGALVSATATPVVAVAPVHIPTAAVSAATAESAAAPLPAGGLCAENGSCYGDISSTTGLPKTTAVQGYYRANGTYVRGYYRSHK